MFGEKPTLERLSEETKACANYTCNVPPTIWLRRCCCCYCLPFPLVYNSFPTANLQNFPMFLFCARSITCVPSPVRCWPNLIEFGRRRRRPDGNACMYLFRLFYSYHLPPPDHHHRNSLPKCFHHLYPIS